MEIVRIFADCLYAVRYDSEEADEFERLFDQWQDIEYLENFFENNKQDLQHGFYGTFSIEEAVKATREEARRLQQDFRRMARKTATEQNRGLDTLFKPLDNNQYRLIELMKSKAKGNRNRSWLRIYAIKVDANLYVVTGGAIKLTATMKERTHTQKELQKIDRCREYMRMQGLIDERTFKELEIWETMKTESIKDKLNKLAVGAPSKWLEKAEWSEANEAWLNKSADIALKVLRALREKGMTQKDLAEKLDVSPQQVSKIVKGKENLTLETISRLEDVLGTKLIATL